MQDVKTHKKRRWKIWRERGGQVCRRRNDWRLSRKGWSPTKEGEAVHRDSPYGSILRPTGAEGGRLGPSIIIGGDGAPPLTGDGPYESPVMIKPTVYRRKTKGWHITIICKEDVLGPASSQSSVGWRQQEPCVVCLPWRGPGGCPEFGLKRGARRSLSWEVRTASL